MAHMRKYLPVRKQDCQLMDTVNYAYIVEHAKACQAFRIQIFRHADGLLSSSMQLALSVSAYEYGVCIKHMVWCVHSACIAAL